MLLGTPTSSGETRAGLLAAVAPDLAAENGFASPPSSASACNEKSGFIWLLKTDRICYLGVDTRVNPEGKAYWTRLCLLRRIGIEKFLDLRDSTGHAGDMNRKYASRIFGEDN